MTTKKQKTAPAQQPPTTTITGCTFEYTYSEMTMGVAMEIAKAAHENARALTAITVALKGPDCLLKVG